MSFGERSECGVLGKLSAAGEQGGGRERPPHRRSRYFTIVSEREAANVAFCAS
jgi:hypothetical protein